MPINCSELDTKAKKGCQINHKEITIYQIWDSNKLNETNLSWPQLWIKRRDYLR